MLIEGECGAQGIDRAAAKFGFSRQRYFQLRTLFLQKGGPLSSAPNAAPDPTIDAPRNSSAR